MIPSTRPAALVIEDVREACVELRERGYECDRIIHNELMTSAGEEYTGKLQKGDYVLVWISTLADWYVRTPGKKEQSTLATTSKLDAESVQTQCAP